MPAVVRCRWDGVGVLALEPCDVNGLAEDLGGGQHGDAGTGEQRRGRVLTEVVSSRSRSLMRTGDRPAAAPGGPHHRVSPWADPVLAVVSADDLRQRGLNLVGVLCVIDRSEGANEVTAAGLELRSLLTLADLGPAA
jgi:hypothetical protein